MHIPLNLILERYHNKYDLGETHNLVTFTAMQKSHFIANGEKQNHRAILKMSKG